jgi:hypothetical protein
MTIQAAKRNQKRTEVKKKSDCIQLNLARSSLLHDIHTPNVFLCGCRNVAVLTMWLPNHYTEQTVTANVLTDNGNTLTIKTVPPKEFLDPVILSATSIAAGSRDNLGQSFGLYSSKLDVNFCNVLVFDLLSRLKIGCAQRH